MPRSIKADLIAGRVSRKTVARARERRVTVGARHHEFLPGARVFLAVEHFGDAGDLPHERAHGGGDELPFARGAPETAATGILRAAHRVDFIGCGPDSLKRKAARAFGGIDGVNGFELACGTKHVQAASNITMHVVRSFLFGEGAEGLRESKMGGDRNPAVTGPLRLQAEASLRRIDRFRACATTSQCVARVRRRLATAGKWGAGSGKQYSWDRTTFPKRFQLEIGGLEYCAMGKGYYAESYMYTSIYYHQ
jgi:hypothetical protein